MAQIQILDGMDVFDAAIMAYGDISMAVKMLGDNPSIFPDWNTTIPGVAIFDESMVAAIVPGVQLVQDVQDDGNRTMIGIANQSIFDVALMTLGTIDRVVELVRNSDGLPINNILADGRVFNFNLNNLSDLNLYLFLRQPGTAAGGTIDMSTNVTGKSYQENAYSSGYN